MAVPFQAGIGLNLDQGPGIPPALVVQSYGFYGGDLHLALGRSRQGLVVSSDAPMGIASAVVKKLRLVSTMTDSSLPRKYT